MTRLEAVTIAIRAINLKIGQTKRVSTRRELVRAREFFANDPAFEWDKQFARTSEESKQ